MLLREDGCATIALNVRADNVPARAAYERIGFRVVARYLESSFERTAPPPG
jgi:ribosomal protein S18 acetylase RimI-like enzyme